MSDTNVTANFVTGNQMRISARIRKRIQPLQQQLNLGKTMATSIHVLLVMAVLCSTNDSATVSNLITNGAFVGRMTVTVASAFTTGVESFAPVHGTYPLTRRRRQREMYLRPIQKATSIRMDTDIDDTSSAAETESYCMTISSNSIYKRRSSSSSSSSSTRDQFVRSVVLFSATAVTTASSSSSAAVISDSLQEQSQSPTMMCQSGQLVQESAIPGAYQSTCMNLSERTVPLSLLERRIRRRRSDTTTTDDSIITVKQQPPGSGSTGMTVWNSGLVLTRLLDAIVDQQHHQQQWNYDDQDIIELGCGTGLVSIACHKLGAKSVIATDGNPQVVELASDNVKRNLEENQQQQKMIEVQSLQWGLLNAMDYAENASLVVGADLTYNAGSWRALAETISTVLRPKGFCIYLSLGHEGFNVNAEIDGFLQVAKSVGLQQTPNNELAGIDVSKLLNYVVLQDESERKVIQQGGGARVIVLERKMYG
mmetsp:Transcript_18926/g.45690  ORF Transcript_18926/g.45690 Transcript_18926/m.45690 type:complete len:481 (-) Transcript_18926:1876-3318(-)